MSGLVVLLCWIVAPQLDMSALAGQEIHVRAGYPLSIDVPISGAPTSTVTWQKDGKPLEDSPRVCISCPSCSWHIQISTGICIAWTTYKARSTKRCIWANKNDFRWRGNWSCQTAVFSDTQTANYRLLDWQTVLRAVSWWTAADRRWRTPGRIVRKCTWLLQTLLHQSQCVVHQEYFVTQSVTWLIASPNAKQLRSRLA